MARTIIGQWNDVASLVSDGILYAQLLLCIPKDFILTYTIRHTYPFVNFDWDKRSHFAYTQKPKSFLLSYNEK